MRISDLLRVLDDMAPFSSAEPWDNCGLLVGDPTSEVRRVLACLELSDEVLDEALKGGFDTILTHHPALFSPVQRLVESDARQRRLRGVIAGGIDLIACHTNLDSAPGGLADITVDVLGLTRVTPLQMAPAGWYKLVGFIPEEALDVVSEAVFAAGAGVIGEYEQCAFAVTGTGRFTPGAGAQPTIGRQGTAERVTEVRWETVVPKSRLEAAIRAFIDAHPYEEPAFDVYPVEDRLIRAGLGRVGDLAAAETLGALARRVAEVFSTPVLQVAGVDREVGRVAIVPGSGRSLLEVAAKQADVLITGDLGHHDAETAQDLGLGLISVPHGDLEWWAMKRWIGGLQERLTQEGVSVALSQRWRSPWGLRGHEDAPAQARAQTTERPPDHIIGWIDGGSRGNPGPAGIGVVLQDVEGRTLTEVARTIGTATNNVAEYSALLEALQQAADLGARTLQIYSDSELLVKQMTGQYRVKNEGLRGLVAEARLRMGLFDDVRLQHVRREQNVRADELVNEALDAQAQGS